MLVEVNSIVNYWLGPGGVVVSLRYIGCPKESTYPEYTPLADVAKILFYPESILLAVYSFFSNILCADFRILEFVLIFTSSISWFLL
jgi:hypothetical protein